MGRRTVPYAAAALAGMLVLAGCRSSYPDAVPDDFNAVLERGPCFGACPVYTLDVSADGAVEYNGIRFVEVEGPATASLSQQQLSELYQAVVDADYFGLENRYEVQATDLPSISTTVTMNGQTKSVYHYGLGCGSDLDLAPAGLCEIEALLEAIPVSNGWVSDQ